MNELDTSLEADWETPSSTPERSGFLRVEDDQEDSRKQRCDLSTGECESCS